MFKGDARNFYKNEVKQLQTWGEAMVVLNKRYKSEAKMRKIIDEIKEISIDDYVA